MQSRFGSDRTTGAVLESLRILPDDDNDGLLDVKGSLKILEDGELLNLGGVVRVGDLVEACVDVVVSRLSSPLHKSGSMHVSDESADA